MNIIVFTSHSGQEYLDSALVFALYPIEVINLNRFETLITSGFLHADLKHLFFNMLFLYLFGDNLEDRLGHYRYLGFYLLCMIGAGLIHVFSCILFGGLYNPVIGASGAISGVVGGYFLLFPKAKIDFLIWIIIFFWVFPLSAWFALGVWIFLELWDVYTGSFMYNNVATFAHLGGFFCGLLLIFPLWIRLGGTKFWHETGGKPPNPEKTSDNRPVKIPIVRKR